MRIEYSSSSYAKVPPLHRSPLLYCGIPESFGSGLALFYLSPLTCRKCWELFGCWLHYFWSIMFKRSLQLIHFTSLILTKFLLFSSLKCLQVFLLIVWLWTEYERQYSNLALQPISLTPFPPLNRFQFSARACSGTAPAYPTFGSFCYVFRSAILVISGSEWYSV